MRSEDPDLAFKLSRESIVIRDTVTSNSTSSRSKCISSNGKLLAIGGNTIKIYDTITGSKIKTINHICYECHFSNDGSKLIIKSDYGSIKILDVVTCTAVKTLQSSVSVDSCCFSLDSSKILYNDGFKVKLQPSFSDNIKIFTGHKNNVFSCIFYDNDSKIVSGSSDNIIKIWDTSTGTCIKSLFDDRHYFPNISSFDVSSNSNLIAIGFFNNEIIVYSLDTGDYVNVLIGHSSCINSVKYSTDGSLLISSSDDGTVKIWDVASGKCIKTLNGHTDEVLSAIFSHDATQIFSCSMYETIIWNFPLGIYE